MILVKNARIFTMAGKEYESGCILTKGKKIAKIAKSISKEDFDENEHGVKVAITTDHPVTRIQYLPICAGFAAKEGLGVDEGLRAITINAAEICNVADRVGSLEVGKDADIAVFDGNPMEVFTNTLYTIINGKVVYRKDSE